MSGGKTVRLYRADGKPVTDVADLLLEDHVGLIERLPNFALVEGRSQLFGMGQAPITSITFDLDLETAPPDLIEDLNALITKLTQLGYDLDVDADEDVVSLLMK